MTDRFSVPDILAPDLIINNGKIVTVDNDFSFAEAVAVKDGRIVSVGAMDEIEALRGASTKTLDLKGRTLIPGINDSHLHLTLGLTSMPPAYYDVSPSKVTTLESLRAVIKDAVAPLAPGEWINGGGWNPEFIEELKAAGNRNLNKNDIDDISPDNPLFFNGFSFHVGVANSAALKAAGIDRNTPDPVGGEIVRDENGEPTGLLFETACDIVIESMPAYSYKKMRELFELNIETLTGLGITSITSGNDRPHEIKFYSNLYRDYAKEGKPFPLRISCLMLWSDSIHGGSLERVQEAFKHVGTTTGFGGDFLRIAGVKIFADGIPPSKTAWCSRPYADGSHGSLVLDGGSDDEKVEHLNKIVDICHENGYQIAFHSCGDLAVKACVDAMARNMEKNPKDLRHYPIHGDWILEETMDKMARYNIPLNTQVDIFYDLCDNMAAAIGAEIVGEQWPLKTLLDKGVRFCNSSDWPVIAPDWRKGVQVAVTRKGRKGIVYGEHNRVSLEAALRSYTVEPAWFDHMEDRKGAIQRGMLADFAVLGRDITSVDQDEIKDIPVHMSIVGGNVIYSDGTLCVE